MKKQPTGTINSAGTCATCKAQSIEYGIKNGFWYYCHTCKKYLDEKNVLNQHEVSRL